MPRVALYEASATFAVADLALSSEAKGAQAGRQEIPTNFKFSDSDPFFFYLAVAPRAFRYVFSVHLAPSEFHIIPRELVSQVE